MSTDMGGGSSDDIPKTKRGRALHDATHGQFGEEPHAGPRPGGEEERPGREKEGRGGESGPAAERVKKAREQSREA